MGSSPLARGTHHDRAHQLCRPGLIPARAGNTCTCMIRGPLMGAHPRSRGEHELAAAQVENAKGSSPLARGTHPRHANPSCLRGLIPARAGNTLPRAVESQTPRAHPRSRGEHVAFGALLDDGVGSSPLARGTQFSRSQGTGSQGLIPARAGNTSPRPLGRTLRGAHPRSRGEH